MSELRFEYVVPKDGGSTIARPITAPPDAKPPSGPSDTELEELLVDLKRAGAVPPNATAADLREAYNRASALMQGGGQPAQPAPDAPNYRRDMLATAEKLVNGDRNTQYGDPIEDFRRTANLWNAYLGIDSIQPHDVASLMALLKLSRIRWSPTKEDSWTDLAGYAACGWDCAARGA